MSKRAHPNESREERWRRKLKRYEQKLEATKDRSSSRRVIYSDDEHDVHNEEHLESDLVGQYQLPETESMEQHDQIPVADVDASAAADDASAAADASTPPVTVPPPPPPPLEPDFDPSLPPAVDVAPEEFDPNLLKELGDIETDPVEYGDDLQCDVAARLQKILQHGLKKEVKDELLKKYPFAKNVPFSKAPTLNPEIGAMLVETCKLRDKRLLSKQDQLGKALSAVGKALSCLLKKKPDVPDVIRTLNDASKILADSHYAETDTRRSVIFPLIDKSLSEPFKDRKRDNFLFGEKLGDLVKDSRGIKKTGQLISASASNSTTSALNGKGPSSRARQRSTQQVHRAAGPRPVTNYPYPYPYPYPNRRRAAAPPPPRRQPPPPPPPARRPAAPPTQRVPASRTT